MLTLVTENQLDEWVRGNAQNAQGVTVELVWSLVAASCPRPLERRFPLPDSIGQHGPDGVLQVDLAFEPFIPEGRSHWEIGTGLKASAKATSDYTDLTAAVPASVRQETAFVFVTPLSGRREWEHTWKEDAQAAWLDQRRAAHEWKDVRVIDGTKLIDWVHQFLAVELWLAQKITGLPAQEIETLEQRWGILRSIGEPPSLIPEVFLSSRDEARGKFKEVLDDTLVQLKLTTHYPDQVTDFAAAHVASLDAESRIDAASRCVIVSGTNAWNALCTFENKHILIAEGSLDLNGESGTRLIQKARKAGHAIVFGGPSGGIPDPTSVALRMPRTHHVREALVKAGYSEERARTLAQKSNGNLGSLLRCLQNLSMLPQWAEGTAAADLAIAAVLGSWTDESRADRAIVEGLSGKAYGEWIGMMREIALRPGTPLSQENGRWKFIPRYEGWYALGPTLFNEHLDKLLATVVPVLREKDPQFDLQPEERYLASVHGKVLAHSRLLRNGLAESLALLGSHPKALTSCSVGKAETTAMMAVRKILVDADWVQWASLDALLPLFAEAAPGEFLGAIEKGLSGDPCPFDELFRQEGKGVFGRTYLSGILWALETLAWDADHLIRVVTCLGELAARDPGGQWANRPGNSLTAILLPWLPQTCAPITKRVSAIRTLLAELPDVGWKLLLNLLPKYHSVSSGTRRPAWRTTIPDEWQEGVTKQEYWQQVSAYSELAISEAMKDVSRIAMLIDQVESLPPPAQGRFLDYLGSDAAKAIPDEDRLRLWTKLVELVAKHRKFPDAEWAMEPNQIEKLASIADQLEPRNSFYRHQRLFSESDFDLYVNTGSYEEQQKELDNRRQNAIAEVANSGGIDAVLAFAKAVQSPWRVGIAWGGTAAENADGAVLPGLLESENKSLEQLAGGYVWGRFRSRGWQWVDSVETSRWTAAHVGKFLSFLPFTQDTWRRSEELLGQDESAYWLKTPANPYEAEKGLELAINSLMQHGRPYAAIRCLHKIMCDKQPFNSSTAVRALLGAIGSAESHHSRYAYEVVEIIKELQAEPSTNLDDLLLVEWAYLQLLDRYSGASPKSLERQLAREPGFFCEVIRVVFRSKNAGHPPEEPSEKEKSMASNGYLLLSNWRIPPGLCEDGTYDGNALTTWLEAVKKECTETGHLEIAMTMVGHVLTHVPPDSDGLWLHCSACAVLNAKDAHDMRDGFSCALHNSRGAHTVDPTGKPERDFAARYRAQADAVDGAGYSRLAVTLRALADSYEHEAEWVSSREPFED